MTELKCLKCEKEMQFCCYTECGTNIDCGRDLAVSFHYGSRHDTTTAMATICDDCFEKYPYLFQHSKCWVRDREWCSRGLLEPENPGRTEAD